MKRAFTLIELMVVIAIIIIIIAVAGIFIPGLLRSSEQSQTIKSIEMAVTTSQANSETYRSSCGLRIERAYKTDLDGFMIKNNGIPVWQDYQQIKFVAFGIKQSSSPFFGYFGSQVSIPPFGDNLDETKTYRKLKNSPTIKLPKNFWVGNQSLDKPWQPSNPEAVPIIPFETCYVIFNYKGEITSVKNWLYYLDETQPYGDKYPIVEHPDVSSKSLIVYDRIKYNADKNEINNGIPLHINRNGFIVKGAE